MKKLFFLFCFMAGLMSLSAQTLIQKFYFDFGKSTDSTSLAASGNYWNNYYAVGASFQTRKLINSSSVVSNYNLYQRNIGNNLNTFVGVNGPNFGPGTNTAALGDLGIGTATTSTIFNNSSGGTGAVLAFKGLNPAKRYKFYIFGSRAATARVNRYTLTGTTSYTDTLTIGYAAANANTGNASGVGVTCNNSRIVQSGLIYPKADSITLALTMFSGTFGVYLNCMKMEEYKGTQTIAFATTNTKSVGDADYAPGANASSGLTVSYTSSNIAVATIVDGKIHIVGVGATTITASQAGDDTYEAATNATQTLTVINPRNIIVCNFDDVSTTTGAWGGNSITPTINPSGGGNVGLVSVPANNEAGITFTTTDKINTASHNKIRFKVYATQAFTFTSEKLDDKTNGNILYNLGLYPAYTTPNQWQEITLDISSATANLYDRITLLAAAWSNIPAFTFYIDDLTLVKKPVITYKSLYVDFGFTTTPTTGADANGNYWNNIVGVPPAFTYIAAGTTFNNLVDSLNTTTPYNLVLQTAGFTPNGGSGNGLMAPEVAQLGKFAIASATEDFLMTTSASENFKMTGLDPYKGYVFSFFGSRSNTETRTTRFSLTGSNVTAVSGTVTTSGVGIGTVSGVAVDYNTRNIYTSTPITPDETGAITVTLTKVAGSWTHMNIMKMVEFNAQQSITLAATANKTTSAADFSPATASSGLAITYSSSNLAVATIVLGQVHIVGPGTTTITAWQAGNTSYDPAAEVTQELTVTRSVVNVIGSMTSVDITPTSNITVSSTGTLTVDASISINNITVDKGGKLTINNGVNLSAMDVNIYSDATGTGTLVDLNTNGGLTVAGTATVQQYLDAARNWYITPPVAGATVPTGQTYFSYDESGSNTGFTAPASAYWVGLSAGTALDSRKGYIVQATGATTMNFNGTLNTGSQSLTLTRTTGKTNEGFNLVANPYPSYLDWKMVSAANSGLLTTAWFRTKNGTGGYIFATVNVADPANPTIVAVNPTTTITTLIPPMQAYWVRVISGSTTYNIDNSMRKHVDNTGNKFKAPAQNSQQLVRLQVSNGTNADEAVVLFNSKATDNLDLFDSPKMSNNSVTIPEIYTRVGAEKLVINGMNTVNYDSEILLGFTTGQANDFSISTTEMTNFEVGTRIILKDKLLNKETDLGAGITYNFSSEITTAASDRFSLIFRSPSVATGLEDKSKLNTQVFVNATNLITIIAPEKASYSIYNALGQLIENGILNAKRETINSKLNAGIYVVKVSDNGRVNSTRVLLNTK